MSNIVTFRRLPDDGVPAPKPLKGILKKPKLAGDYESSSEGEEEDMAVDEAPAAAPVGSTNTGTVGSLPAGESVTAVLRDTTLTMLSGTVSVSHVFVLIAEPCLLK